MVGIALGETSKCIPFFFLVLLSRSDFDGFDFAAPKQRPSTIYLLVHVFYFRTQPAPSTPRHMVAIIFCTNIRKYDIVEVEVVLV